MLTSNLQEKNWSKFFVNELSCQILPYENFYGLEQIAHLLYNFLKKALQKDGWTITHDPFYLRVVGIEMMIDLGAEKILAAEKQGEKIAVEVKSFVSPSNISEFHTAVGQFLNYKQALDEQEQDRVLYLAVPLDIYETFFSLRFIQTAIHHHQIKLIIYEPQEEIVVKWQA